MFALYFRFHRVQPRKSKHRELRISRGRNFFRQSANLLDRSGFCRETDLPFDLEEPGIIVQVVESGVVTQVHEIGGTLSHGFLQPLKGVGFVSKAGMYFGKAEGRDVPAASVMLKFGQ